MRKNQILYLHHLLLGKQIPVIPLFIHYSIYLIVIWLMIIGGFSLH